MKRSLQKSLALALLFLGFAYSDGFARQKTAKPVQTTSITGSYKYILNTLEVLELPDHKVRISFAGVWPNSRRRAETRNVGTFDETVPLKGRTAVVKPKYGNGECAITLEFKANKVIVTQEGYSCGFGFNVEADGSYAKVSGKPPKLPPPDSDQ
ncbi:MAG TPA: hypothetical protein VN687_06900 [Blastocatellia bacterium]|nr:hypothetical protein [Blastocatellia bacterium]